MFNDRFNDRVSRYRLRAHLVLAVLVLFGLGAGHLATRALGAPSPTRAAKAVFSDSTGLGVACRLKSDGSPFPYENGTNCVENYVQGGGGWHMFAPARGDCSTTRWYTLVLGPTPYGCPVSPVYPADPNLGPLYTCGTNQVWGQFSAINLFGPQAGKQGTSMVVYIRTSPQTFANFGFWLEYVNYLRVTNITKNTDGTESRTVTTDPPPGPSADLTQADLYLIVPNGGGWTKGPWLGAFSVPCSITVTKGL